jgi:hypothetical protein
MNPEELAPILDSLKGARKFADPASPVPVRAMAASGVLPIPPTQMSTVLYVLSHDADAAVREKASQSLAALPDPVLHATLAGEVPPGLLAALAEIHRDDVGKLEVLALNPHTSDRTFCMLAALPHGRINDIVSRNQTRLLRCSELLEALGDNPITSAATLDRVLEFLGLRANAPPRRDTSEPIEIPEPAPGTADAPDAPVAPELANGIPPALLDDAALVAEDEETARGLFSLISKMNVMQRVDLARFGNAEARSILIRDSNKLVSSAAIHSPKLSENEVLGYCKNKAVPEEVIRIISASREWTRNRSIKYALCVNPKTPIADVMKFLTILTDSELRSIIKSRDVAAQVVVNAQRLLLKKGKA